MVVVGVKFPKSNNGPWAPYRVQPRSRRKWDAKRTSGPTLMSPNLFKKRSEEECLLERAKYGLNVHPIHNKESLQRILVVRASLTKPGEGREYGMSRGTTTAALNAGKLLSWPH